MDILARNDGREMKPLPIITDNTLMRNEEKASKALFETPEKTHEGFNTHIKCRWCCGEIKEVYIPKFKDGYNGKPVSLVFNYVPCNDCKEKWANLIVCIETTANAPYANCLPISYDDSKTDENGTPIKIPVYPTGRYVGLFPEASESIFGTYGKSIKKGDIAYFDCEMFNTAFSKFFPAEA